MTGHPSSPLAAAVGLVAVTADGLRRLPRALGAVGVAAYRRYDELALHGRDVLAGRARSDSEEQVFAGPAGTGAPTGSGSDGHGRRAGSPSAAEIAEATAPGSGSAAATPPIGRSEPVVLPEDVQEEVAQLTPGAELDHGELPLADFDHMTLPQLRGRLRTLGLAELVQLRDYEQAHAARLPVLTVLDNRIAKLLTEPTSSESGQ